MASIQTDGNRNIELAICGSQIWNTKFQLVRDFLGTVGSEWAQRPRILFVESKYVSGWFFNRNIAHRVRFGDATEMHGTLSKPVVYRD